MHCTEHGHRTRMNRNKSLIRKVSWEANGLMHNSWCMRNAHNYICSCSVSSITMMMRFWFGCWCVCHSTLSLSLLYECTLRSIRLHANETKFETVRAMDGVVFTFLKLWNKIQQIKRHTLWSQPNWFPTIDRCDSDWEYSCDARCAETHRGRFRLIRRLRRAYRFSEYSSSIAYSPVETRNGIIALRMRVRKSALILFSFEASPLLTYFDFCLRMNIEAFRTGDGRSLSS